MVANERKLDNWTGKLKRDLHLPCGFCPFEFQSIKLKMKNWRVIFNFGFIWSFVATGFCFWPKICRPAADTEKSACKRTTSGTLGIQNYTKYGQGYRLLIGIIKYQPPHDQEYGTRVWTPNWYSLRQTWEDSLASLHLYRKSRRKVIDFFSLGTWFCPNFRANTNLVAPCHTERKILSPTQFLHPTRYCAREMFKNALCKVTTLLLAW